MVVSNHRWNSVWYKPVPRDRYVAVTLRGTLMYHYASWCPVFDCFVVPRFMTCNMVPERLIAFWADMEPAELLCMDLLPNMTEDGVKFRAQAALAKRQGTT